MPEIEKTKGLFSRTNTHPRTAGMPVKIVGEDTNPNIQKIIRFFEDYPDITWGKGVEVVVTKDGIHIKSKAWFFYFLGLMIAGSIFMMIVFSMYMKKTQAKNLVQKETKKVSQKQKKEKEFDFVKFSNKKIKGLENEEIEEEISFKHYESKEEIYDLVEYDKAASRKIYKEAIKLRQKGNKTEKKKFYFQAMHRLLALLKKGELSNYLRRQTAYQLWAVYHCHLRWKKSAKALRKIVLLYNKKANKKIKLICPKL